VSSFLRPTQPTTTTALKTTNRVQSTTTRQPVDSLNGILINGQNGAQLFNPLQPEYSRCHVTVPMAAMVGTSAVLFAFANKVDVYYTSNPTIGDVYVYDMVKNNWTSSAHLQTPRDYAAMTAFNGFQMRGKF
jgi:hypothetical protein